MAFFHENIILPLSDLLTHQCVHRHLRFLLQSTSWDNQTLHEFQQKLFKKLLTQTIKQVPYYTDLLSKNTIPPIDELSLESLSYFPIIDKTVIREGGLPYFSSINNTDGILCHSSGTTGEPFAYYVSPQAYSFNVATKLRTWYETGYRIGDPYVKIASAPRNSFIKRLQDIANNCTHIPFTSLDQSTLQSILRKIDSAKPTIIRAHPNVLFYLALERDKGNYRHFPYYIMTTSSTLTDIYRETIKESFHCDIIDSYSCEGTANIAETPAHDGYHISHEYGIIEVLDERNNPVNNGLGHVVSTDLWNTATPFIRYNTHDLVEVKDGVIVRIIGRENELLIACNGKRYTGQVVCDYFSYETHGVLAYQLVQQKDGVLVIRIVPDRWFNETEKEKITSDWHQKTGQIVSVLLVDHIPTCRNGKSLTIVTE